MYQVLARKYRPQSFAELIGQEHVRTTLDNAIAANRIAHGYIFAGQRGTGKTTVARILARCLNCERGPTASPCGVCASCREIAAGGSVDVIEIDAASNRGINEMRELRESIKYRPARDRYKVFIIDEAHQITNEAFNALLKTLEEPPEWVVFILCTTEAHKIPTTIASRCQQFAFRSVDFAEVVARLEWVCRQEGVEAGPEELAVLAAAGEGSVRDSLSALDQAIACCGNRLDVAEVRQLLGMFSLESLHQVTEALAGGDSRRMLEIVQQLERDGRNLQHFCRELARYFRNLLVAKIAGAGSRLIAAADREQERLAEIAASFSEEDLTRYLQLTLDLFRDLQVSLQPRLHLEVGLLRLVNAGKLVAIEEALALLGSGASSPPAPKGPASPSSRSGPAPTGGRPAPRAYQAAPAPSTPAASAPERAAPPSTPAPSPIQTAEPAGFQGRLLAALNERGMTFIADAVEHASITEAENEIRFVAGREFQLALQSPELQTIAQTLAGHPVRVKVISGENAVNSAAPARAGVHDDDAERRALANPDVQRFQRLFPGSQVRAVRNLKDT
ncbi:MAG: DNA polymerase III subunit gamma/tau [Bryobacteraceae bacterium]|nr:DNA polymerase III subunit gamma/tau [Bryobacteraceae bacterium]